jgi:predicted ATPase/DNA-binding winged helix-turn-helix (wHTH) protein
MNATADRNDHAFMPVRFGHCELRPHERELRVDGRYAPLGSRTFDLLLLLVKSAGELVTKSEMLSGVWPRTIVEENTIQAHICALRKALGRDRGYLKTVSGRGYRFVAHLSESPTVNPAGIVALSSIVEPPSNVPAPTSELIGREDVLANVIDLMTKHRLVTLVGPGGIGKTRIGLEAARHLRQTFADGVWLAELASLHDPELVAPAVIAALRLEPIEGVDSADRLAKTLAGKSLLLVLDDCEHVIEAATHVAEALLAASPAVRVIATSREQLRADGERIFRVPALDVSPECSDDVEELLSSGAARLFFNRANAAGLRLSVDHGVATAAAAICRRLDGIPLAIELAASRVAALGVEAVAARLDDRFELLTGGRRTALARHRTLRAAMDWSYDLLRDPERVTLRRLSIFAGSMTFEAVRSVLAGEISANEIMDHIVNLVAKSLVIAEVGGPVARYRMLETTRQYALEKLIEAGEFERIAHRHAQYFCNLFERAEAEGDTPWPTNAASVSNAHCWPARIPRIQGSPYRSRNAAVKRSVSTLCERATTTR